MITLSNSPPHPPPPDDTVQPLYKRLLLCYLYLTYTGQKKEELAPTNKRRNRGFSFNETLSSGWPPPDLPFCAFDLWFRPPLKLDTGLCECIPFRPRR